MNNTFRKSCLSLSGKGWEKCAARIWIGILGVWTGQLERLRLKKKKKKNFNSLIWNYSLWTWNWIHLLWHCILCDPNIQLSFYSLNLVVAIQFQFLELSFTLVRQTHRLFEHRCTEVLLTSAKIPLVCGYTVARCPFLPALTFQMDKVKGVLCR